MVEIIKNNKLKFIITGGILLVFIIVLIILNANNNKIKFVNKNIDINDPNVELYKDYDSGNISVDEYVLYSAYMIFEPEKLDEKYKGDGIVVNAQNIMNLVDMYEDKLSDKTINYIYSKMMMENITLGEQASVSYVEDGITPVSNKIAETANKTNLNKYKISSEGNFVVWYTTEGNDAITDDAANEIASNLEEYVKIYENTYNVEFKWEKAYFGQTTDEDYKNYLDSIAPNDAEKLFDAMPVFISSSSESKEGSIIIAFYSQMEPGKRYLEQGNDVPISNGIKVGPYINIHPEYIMDDSLINYRSSLAHELFHHFQEYICGDGTYKICDTNSAGNQLFIIETSAEWASSKVVSTDIIDTNFIPLLENNDQRLDTLLEYSTQSFLMNYENIVQDGNTKILNSLRSPNGDTLKSLYEQTDNMAEVMKSLSTNILLNNYNSDSFDGVGKYNFVLLQKSLISTNALF